MERGECDLAGYALSHALWSISDEGPLCTLALIEAQPGEPHLSVEGLAASLLLPASRFADGMRTLLRFEADAIEESIHTAQALISASAQDIARSALAWDGYVTSEGSRLDAILIEVASHGVARFTIAQRYQPSTPHGSSRC